MKRVVIIATVIAFLCSIFIVSFAMAADVATIGPKKIPLVGQTVSSLKGRVYAQWSDNPDGEILFGILYWNTADPASAEPSGRTSDTMEVRPPEELFTCCAWGFTGGTDKNNAYAGWYNPGITVRLKVESKSLMDRLVKASQELIAVEVNLRGNTITNFTVLRYD